MISRPATRGVAIVALAAMIGCNSSNEQVIERVAVTGKVTLDGKPLDDAVIRFVPTADNPGPKTMLTIQAGQFQADAEHGPSVGSHRVEIDLKGSEELAPDDEEALQRLKAQRISRVNRPTLPAVYNESSTLTANIDKANNQPLQFALHSK